MSLLLDEPPLVVQPALVRVLGGMVEAVITQQIHYWLQRSSNEYDGETWVYKTYTDWADEIGLSADQVRRALTHLEADGVVISCKPRAAEWHHTKWYRIDYHCEPLAEAAECAISKWRNRHIGDASSPDRSGDNHDSSYSPESTTENTSKTTSVVGTDRGFEEFWDIYPKRNGKKLGKNRTLAKWRRMNLTDRRGAYRSAINYAAACTSGLTKAKDPERFIPEYWRDWLDPATPDAPSRRTSGTTSAAQDLLNDLRAEEECS